MARLMILTLLVATMGSPGSAYAQAHKCKGPDGVVTYSDQPCAGNQTGGAIVLRENRLDHSDARARNERLLLQMEQRAIQEQKETQARVAKAKAERRAVVIAKLSREMHGEKRRDVMEKLFQELRDLPPTSSPSTPGATPSPPSAAGAPFNAPTIEPPSPLVNCDPAGCWDTSGRRLTDTGGGTFHRSDGKFCIGAGSNVICH